jgi:hypothetical protein
MKNITYLLALFVLGAMLASCEYDPFEEEDSIAAIQDSSEAAFVRFDNSLSGGIAATEADSLVTIRIDFPFPAATDIDISFEFSGSATFGTDFSVDGATDAGGSVRLVHDPDVVAQSSVDLEVFVLKDDVVDGEKEVTITLTSASATNGDTIDAGQGSLHKAVTITIADIDM